MDQVLNTSELLEMVLSHVPIRTLLLAQRVDRAWKSLITTSPVLQQKLFLRPTSELQTTADVPELNDLLQETFPPFFEIKAHESVREWPYASAISSLPWAQNDRTREAVLRKEASWRHMLPTQPPPRFRQIEVSYSQFTVQTQRCTLVDDTVSQQPAKMGQIYDLVEEFTSDSEIHHFYLHWHMFPQSGSCIDLGHSIDREESARKSNERKNELSIYTLGFVSCIIMNDDPEQPRFRSLGCDLPKLHCSEWS